MIEENRDGSDLLDELMNLGTEFERDWPVLAKRYSQGGIQISETPEEELSEGQAEAIKKAYESSRDAGQYKVREVIKSILERKKKSINQTLDSLVQDFEDAELRDASERRKPLSREAKRKAKRLGTNVELLKQFLSVSYQDLADVTGLSRSSLHKIGRMGRIPRITALYHLEIGIGVPQMILLAETETLRSLDRLADVPSGLQHKVDELESTTDEMGEILHGDPEKGEKDPGDWLSEMLAVAEEVVRYYQEVVKSRVSNGAIMSAVIGRHYGGRYGAFLAAHVAEQMRPELERENLGGFSFPSSYLRGKIEKYLQRRDEDITLNR